MKPHVSMAAASGWKVGVTNSASAMASPRRTLTGIEPELNGGHTKIHAVDRVIASRKAESRPVSIVRCTGRVVPVLASAEHARQVVEQALGELHELGEHPVAAGEDHEADGQELRHEGERRLL